MPSGRTSTIGTPDAPSSAVVSPTQDIPDVAVGVLEEDKVRGIKAVAYELHVAEKTVKKLAMRTRRPLPLMADHTGFWAAKGALAQWVSEELKTYAVHMQEEQEEARLLLPTLSS
jgi:hypothetical protein